MYPIEEGKIPVKQVIVMRKDLNMRKGKIAAQAGHACVTSIFKAINNTEDFSWWIDDNGNVKSSDKNYLAEWLNSSYRKICVYVNSEEELLDIAKRADEKKLTYALIQDSGFTEFHGVATYTCIGFEPLPDEVINEITGHLPLF